MPPSLLVINFKLTTLDAPESLHPILLQLYNIIVNVIFTIPRYTCPLTVTI